MMHAPTHSATEIVCVIEDGITSDCSPAAECLFSLQRKQLEGTKLENLSRLEQNGTPSAQHPARSTFVTTYFSTGYGPGDLIFSGQQPDCSYKHQLYGSDPFKVNGADQLGIRT